MAPRIKDDGTAVLAALIAEHAVIGFAPELGGIRFIEARQLRGQSTAQVPDARLAVAHGNGGMLGSRHTAGTLVLARD